MMVEVNETEMKGGRMNIDTDRMVGGNEGEKGNITGGGEAFSVENGHVWSRIADSQEAGGRRQDAFPCLMAGSSCSRHSCRISVGDSGDDGPPRWFLNK